MSELKRSKTEHSVENEIKVLRLVLMGLEALSIDINAKSMTFLSDL